MSPSQSWIALTVAALGAGAAFAQTPSATLPGDGRGLIPPAGISKVGVLAQNWTDEEANKYYNTSQGSQMMPYAWFLHLEQADSTTKFRDTAHMLNYGFLPRKADANGNPDGLPIGFVQNGNQIGLNCAACHTGQINHKETTLLIDGAPTMSDATTMLEDLEAALRATLKDNDKFARLAQAVLGPVESDDTRAEMKKDLELVLKMRSDYNARNFPHGAQPAFGPGRIDAFGAILNEVAVRFAKSPTGAAAADAPVSFPFLWDTPQHDFVQWNGSAENKIVPFLEPILGTKHIGALGRNVGEVLGVFGDVNTAKPEFLR
ncbi:MAG TPA: di-heme-cytochrome C peroxidase, partial [Chthoniobacteraceae bacterium]|nr:di-heme-cytochrome C peroxidase [Chthoniobacteraceae bacterium]